jgi:capsular polysaccharide biosynthesis protein
MVGPLSGTIPTAADWVSKNPSGRIARIDAGEIVRLAANSKAVGRAPQQPCAPERIRFPDLYTATLPNARILDGEGSLVLDNRLVLDMSPHYGHSRHDHYALIRRQLPHPGHLDCSALILTGINARNHYHWLLDILPRFEVARRSGFGWDCIVGPASTPVQRACYERLDIDRGTIIKPPFGGQLMLREAIVSSFPSLRFAPSPFAVRFIRELFKDCLTPDHSLPRRVYISRGESANRRVLNESEVREALARLDIEPVPLESMTIELQAQLFANADLIVAPHGAGLANCAFCRPGTRLIEAFGARYTPGFFRRLAAIRGMDYQCLVDGNSTPGHEDTVYMHDDMHIDVARLQELLAHRGGADIRWPASQTHH